LTGTRLQSPTLAHGPGGLNALMLPLSRQGFSGDGGARLRRRQLSAAGLLHRLGQERSSDARTWGIRTPPAPFGAAPHDLAHLDLAAGRDRDWERITYAPTGPPQRSKSSTCAPTAGIK
jgi:hypothetical protein